MVDGRVCGQPLGEGKGLCQAVVPGSASSRCDSCRSAHRRAKKADYQWAYRLRKLEEKRADSEARGNRWTSGPPVEPRDLTPSWTQQGHEVEQDQADRLQDLVRQLDEVQGALDRVREALRDASRP